MDAFEQIAARLFEVQGYWTRIGYAVELTKAQKASIGQPSLPRPQLDVLGYSPSKNELLIIECKSYLDSRGVMFAGFHGKPDADKDVYKMFNREPLRGLVIASLLTQLRSEGLLTEPEPTVRLVLVAGKVYASDEPKLRDLFAQRGWTFIGPSEVAAGVRKFANRGYENDVITIVTKVLERNRS